VSVTVGKARSKFQAHIGQGKPQPKHLATCCSAPGWSPCAVLQHCAPAGAAHSCWLPNRASSLDAAQTVEGSFTALQMACCWVIRIGRAAQQLLFLSRQSCCCPWACLTCAMSTTTGLHFEISHVMAAAAARSLLHPSLLSRNCCTTAKQFQRHSTQARKSECT